MTQDTLFQLFYDWVTSVVGPSVTVIKSHSKGPAPRTPYITIGMSGNWHQKGLPAHMTSDPTLISPRVHDSEVELEIWESNGSGDLLRALVKAVDTYASVELMEARGVSILTTDGPSYIPALEDSVWSTDFLLRLNLLIAEIETTDTTYIETVELINQIGGT